MITIVNLNASVDKKYNIDNIVKGKVMRARSVENTAGGKGIHVANIAHILGENTLVTGYIGGNTGEFIQARLDAEGIKSKFVKIEGTTRECLAFMTDDAVQTEILEPGPYVTEEEQDYFMKMYESMLEDSGIVAASGSVPKNVPESVYADLINMANKKGRKFLLDTSGELLRLGIDAVPFMIKPNKEELETLTGRKISDEKDVVKCVMDLSRKNIKCIVVSLGAQGSVVYFDGKMFRVTVPCVKAVNPVGSGDSLVGGFAVGIERDYSMDDIIALGTACGTANAMLEKTGYIEPELVRRIMKEVSINRIKL